MPAIVGCPNAVAAAARSAAPLLSRAAPVVAGQAAPHAACRRGGALRLASCRVTSASLSASGFRRRPRVARTSPATSRPTPTMAQAAAAATPLRTPRRFRIPRVERLTEIRGGCNPDPGRSGGFARFTGDSATPPSRTKSTDLTPHGVVVFNSSRHHYQWYQPGERKNHEQRGARESFVGAAPRRADFVTVWRRPLALVFRRLPPLSRAAHRQALYVARRLGGEAGEASLTTVEQYWQTRLTYPTGRFNQRWVERRGQAAEAPSSPAFRVATTGAGGAGPACIRPGAQSVKALAAARPSGRSRRRAPAARLRASPSVSSPAA